MKLQITITPNSNKMNFLFVDMCMNEVKKAIEKMETRTEVAMWAEENLKGTQFFYGFGSSHFWVHHNSEPAHRCLIAIFPN